MRLLNSILPVFLSVAANSTENSTVELLSRQVELLTQQMTSLKQSHESLQRSYEDLLQELQERNENGLIFLPFEKLHEKILHQGRFYDGVFAELIDHEQVTILDEFILADVFISDSANDHFTVTFSGSNDCSGIHFAGTSSGSMPQVSFHDQAQKATLVFDGSQENNSFPRWEQWS